MNNNYRDKIHLFSGLLFAFAMNFGIKAIQIAGAIWFITWIIQCKPKRLKTIWSEKDNLQKAFFYSLVIFFIWHLIGLFYTTDLKTGIKLTQVRIYFLLFPITMLCNNQLYKKYYNLILLSFVLGATTAGSIALIRAIYLHTLKHYDASIFTYLKFSIFNHPSYQAMMANFAIAILFYSKLIPKNNYFLKSFKQITLKIAKIITISLLSLFVILYSSRANLVVFTFIWIIFFTQLRIKSKFLILLTFFFVLVAVFSRNERIIATFDTTGKSKYELQNNRFIIWNIAKQKIAQQWLWGVGTGDIKQTLIKEYIQNNLYKFANRKLNIHNDFLENFLRFGIFGFILFIANFIISLIIAIKYRNTTLIYLIIIFAINEMLESMTNRITGNAFWTFWVSSITLVNIDNNSKKQTIKNLIEQINLLIKTNYELILALTIIGYALFWSFYGINIDFYDNLISDSWLIIKNFNFNIWNLPADITSILLIINGINTLLWLKFLYILILTTQSLIIFFILKNKNIPLNLAFATLITTSFIALIGNPMAITYFDWFITATLLYALIISKFKTKNKLIHIILIIFIIQSLILTNWKTINYQSLYLLTTFPAIILIKNIKKTKIYIFTALLISLYAIYEKNNNVFAGKNTKDFVRSVRNIPMLAILYSNDYNNNIDSFFFYFNQLKNYNKPIAANTTIFEYLTQSTEKFNNCKKIDSSQICIFLNHKHIDNQHFNIYLNAKKLKIYIRDTFNFWYLKKNWIFPQDSIYKPFFRLDFPQNGTYIAQAQIKIEKKSNMYNPRMFINFIYQDKSKQMKNIYLTRDGQWHTYTLINKTDSTKKIEHLFFYILYMTYNAKRDYAQIKNIKLLYKPL